VYNKAKFLGLLWDKFQIASNGRCVEEAWNNYKAIFHEGIERFVPHKILRKSSDPECYSRDVKRLKFKVRKDYNRRNLGQQYREELKRLSKKL
jgi:hypothetical protein